MSTPRRSNDRPKFSIGEISLPDFDIAWAGDFPWAPGYCLGSEDGRIQIVGHDGKTIAGPYDVAPSGESINGVAFTEDLMAVSTRRDVTFMSVPLSHDGRVERAVYRGGAFDVVATPDGGFVAPMGRNGLLLVGKKQSGSQKVTILKGGEEGFNVYKVVPLASEPVGGLVLACAARTDGFAIMTVGSARTLTSGRRLRAPGVDFIDVCPMGSSAYPLAAVALGLDGSLHFTYDAMKDQGPKTLRFDEIRGRAYRVFCYLGHIILLTSEGVYSLMDVGSRFLDRERLEMPTMARSLGFQPVDAELTSTGQLLVVMPDGIYQVGLDALTAADDGTNAMSRQATASNGMGTMSVAPDVEIRSWDHIDEIMWEESGELALAGVA